MRKLLAALFLGSLFMIPIGCGGAPDEADTSHLESDEAKKQAEAARAQYTEAGRGTPKADDKTGAKTQ
jgi:hypothetical protein